MFISDIGLGPFRTVRDLPKVALSLGEPIC